MKLHHGFRERYEGDEIVMGLHYILNKGDGLDAVIVATEREGIEAEKAALPQRFARLYRVAIPIRRDGKRVEHWESRYEGNWYGIERDNLPLKLLDLAATLGRGQ